MHSTLLHMLVDDLADGGARGLEEHPSGRCPILVEGARGLEEEPAKRCDQDERSHWMPDAADVVAKSRQYNALSPTFIRRVSLSRQARWRSACSDALPETSEDSLEVDEMVDKVCEDSGNFPAQLHRYLLIKRFVEVRRWCKLDPDLKATCFQPLNMRVHTVLST